MKEKLLLFLFSIFAVLACEKSEEPTMAEITSFEILAQVNGQDEVFIGKIDGSEITIDLPARTNIKAISPIIEVNAGSTVTPKSGTVKNFEQPVVYTVINGSTVVKYNVTITNTKAKVYKIFHFGATKDVVVGMLDAFASDESVTCLINEGRGAIDLRYLPKNIILVANQATPQTNVSESGLLVKVLEIAEKDKSAEFIFYNTWTATTDLIISKVIPEIGFDRCKYVYLEDGAGDYSKAYDFFSNPANKIAFEQADYLTNILMERQLSTAERLQWVAFPSLSVQQSFFVKPKAECWFNYPEAFAYVKFPIDKKYRENYTQKDPIKMFAELSAQKQEEFIKAMRIDKTVFESTKPRLIITGSNSSNLARINAAQMNMVKDAIAKYGNDYTIFFKGHPANPVFDNDLRQVFKNGEVRIIPYNVPFEILNAAGFGGDKILGIFSTLYFGVPQDRIIAIYFTGTQIDGQTYDYVREMLIPTGAFPSDMSKYRDFYSHFETTI